MNKYLFSFAFVLMFLHPVPAAAQNASQGVPTPSSQQPGAAELKDALRRLARNRRNVDALIDAGNASLKLNSADAALNFFRRAENLRSNDGRVKAGIGASLVRLENPFEALRYFDESARLGTSASRIAIDRGLAFDLLGNFERAQQDYNLAARVQNSDLLKIRHAVSLSLSGKNDESDALLSPLLRQNNAAAWRARAFTLAARGKFKEAREVARGFLDTTSAKRVEPFLKSIPKLTAAQQAAAIHLGHFPTRNVGRDSRNVRTAAANLPPASPARGSDRLIPSGQPLGQQPYPRAVKSSSPASRPAARVAPQKVSLAQQLIAEAALASANVRAILPPAPKPAPKPLPAPAVASVPPTPKPTQPAKPTSSVPIASAAAVADQPKAAVAKAAPIPPAVAATTAVKPVAAAEPLVTPQTAAPPPVAPVTAAPKVAAVPAKATPAKPSFGFESLDAANSDVVKAASPPANGTPVTPSAPTVASPAPEVPVASKPTSTAVRPPSTAVTPPSTPQSAGLSRPPAKAVGNVAPIKAVQPPMQTVSPVEPAPPAPAKLPVRTANNFSLEDIVNSIDTAPEQQSSGNRQAVVIPDARPAPKPAAKIAASPPPGAKTPPPAKPKAADGNISTSPRYWVQIATGPMSSHKGEYRRLSRKYAKLFEGQEGWSSVWKNTGRLVVGPFAGFTPAKEWYEALKEAGGDGFVWNSARGTQVKRLNPN